jgi:hypothetical protein
MYRDVKIELLDTKDADAIHNGEGQVSSSGRFPAAGLTESLRVF